MTTHALVCPGDPRLLDRLPGTTVVLEVKTPAEVEPAFRAAREREIDVYRVVLRTSLPLTHAELRPEWKGIPLELHAPSLGKFSQIAPRLRALRELDLCVHLPSSAPDACTGLRILSSLGIPCALRFDRKHIDWGQVTDLMTYALLGSRPHAPIEPFQTIADSYAPDRHTPFGTVYFDDPTRFLHLDGSGKVALSRTDRASGRFVRQSPDRIGDLQEDPEYHDRLDAWKQHFLKTDGCAYCPAWRICMGYCEDLAGSNGECRDSFTELLEVVEQYQAKRTEGRAAWQS